MDAGGLMGACELILSADNGSTGRIKVFVSGVGAASWARRGSEVSSLGVCVAADVGVLRLSWQEEAPSRRFIGGTDPNHGNKPPP